MVLALLLTTQASCLGMLLSDTHLLDTLTTRRGSESAQLVRCSRRYKPVRYDEGW